MREIIILLPILGECRLRTVPKALPWADLFWPSRPCLPQPSTLPSLLLPFLGECWLRTVPLPSLFLYGGKELWSFLQSPTLYKQESPKLLISLELNNSTFVSSCRVYFSKEARSCGVFYQPPVQADMLSACMEYEDILSDKQRGAHPSPPKGREPDTHPQPLPKGGGQGTSTYTFRRICYPPEQKEPGIRGALSPLPWGGVGGGSSVQADNISA